MAEPIGVPFGGRANSYWPRKPCGEVITVTNMTTSTKPEIHGQLTLFNGVFCSVNNSYGLPIINYHLIIVGLFNIVVFVSVLLLVNKASCVSQRRQRRPSYGQLAVDNMHRNNWETSDMWFLRYVGRQTDRQTRSTQYSAALSVAE